MYREHRPARLRCDECEHEFVARVPHVAHRVDEVGGPMTPWVVEEIDVGCPKCRSYFVAEQEG